MRTHQPRPTWFPRPGDCASVGARRTSTTSTATRFRTRATISRLRCTRAFDVEDDLAPARARVGAEGRRGRGADRSDAAEWSRNIRRALGPSHQLCRDAVAVAPRRAGTGFVDALRATRSGAR